MADVSPPVSLYLDAPTSCAIEPATHWKPEIAKGLAALSEDF
jgi:hypothetical protein